jgi:hypothetical protein
LILIGLLLGASQLVAAWRQGDLGLWCQYEEIEKNIPDPTTRFWLRQVPGISLEIILATTLLTNGLS